MVHSKLWNETSLSLKLTFVPLEGETQQLHVGHQGWGQRLHSMKYPQHRQHATLQRLDQAELLAALEEGAGSPLAAKPRWTVARLNIAGREGALSFMLGGMCVFI